MPSEPIPVKDALRLVEHPALPSIGRNGWQSAKERFWNYIRDGENGCWNWVGHKNDCGYGLITSAGQKGRRVTRIMWEIANGSQIPDGMSVLHSCDNPACVFPWHLSLGTQAENMGQMKSRDRSLKGSKCGRSRLKESQALEILRRCCEGETQLSVATMFGVSPTCVNKIVRGLSWNIPSIAALKAHYDRVRPDWRTK